MKPPQIPNRARTTSAATKNAPATDSVAPGLGVNRRVPPTSGTTAEMPQLPPDEFPYLNESAAELVAAGYDPAEEFIFGLDLVLAALEPLRASA